MELHHCLFSHTINCWVPWFELCCELILTVTYWLECSFDMVQDLPVRDFRHCSERLFLRFVLTRYLNHLSFMLEMLFRKILMADWHAATFRAVSWTPFLPATVQKVHVIPYFTLLPIPTTHPHIPKFLLGAFYWIEAVALFEDVKASLTKSNSTYQFSGVDHYDPSDVTNAYRNAA